MKDMTDRAFWEALDALAKSSEVVIDRLGGTYHPRYPEMAYPIDYGYLKNTTSMDSHGIDVWRGTDPSQRFVGLFARSIF